MWNQHERWANILAEEHSETINNLLKLITKMTILLTILLKVLLKWPAQPDSLSMKNANNASPTLYSN